MTDNATKLASIAERQLGCDPDLLDPNVAKNYLNELKAHMSTNPEDDNFTVELERGEPRAVLCMEHGCDGAVVAVRRRNGSERGISLDEYREHVRDHPTHAAMRDARVREHGPALPTTSTTTPRPRPRPVPRFSVKKEDMPASPSISLSRKRSHSTMQPVKTEPKPVRVKAEPNDVIDLSGDYPDRAPGPSARPLKRQKTLENDVESKPLSSLVNRPASSTVAVDKENLRDKIRDVQAEIARADKRLQVARRKSRPSKADKTRISTYTAQRNALVAQKNDLESKLAGLSNQSGSFTLRSFNGPVKNEPVEPPMPVASTSRAVLPRTPARVKAEPFPASLGPVKREANAVASSSRAKLPAAPAPFVDFDSDDDTKDNKSAVLNATVEASAPAGGKPRDLDDIAPQPDQYREDPYDEEGNYFGRGKDTFVGPQAQADDLDKFLVTAGNAEMFDGNETVGTALKALRLPDLTSTMPGMSVALMPHQVIGVAWMLQREASAVKGGCLADEMGLGKTVQTIATMVANLPKKGSTRVKTTLILAPLALLPQWKQEIEDKTDGSFKTIIYHGTNKPRDIEDILEYDFVLTTLSTLALEWPDPEEDTRREKKEKKGKAKAKSQDEDFIVDDDSDVPVPVKAKGKGKQKKLGTLFRVAWLRVVVDEAHMIKNKKTRVSRAVTKLVATYRWALTGTPIVNSLQDAYGILRFLQVRPWYDWKEFNDRIALLERKNPKLAAERLQSVFKTMQLRRKKDSKLNGKPLIELPPREVKIIKIDFSEEERDLYGMIERQEQAKFNRFLRAGTVLKNYHQIFVMILRLRQICSHPSLIQEGKAAAMIIGDGDDDLSQDSKDELSRAQELLGVNFVAKIKDQRLQIAKQRIEAEKDDVDATVEEEECAICLDSPNDPVVTQCGHVFCRECITDVFTRPRQEADGTFRAGQDRDCPNCRGTIFQEKLFSLAAFEPTDFDLNPKIKTDRLGKFTAIDSDIEMLDDSDADVKPARKDKGKGKAKARIQPGRSTRRRVSYMDSEDDDEHSEIDDELSDFIIEDDEDEEEHEARRALKKRLGGGKSKAPAKKVRRKGIVLDSEDEFESEEEEVVFGKPKKEKVVLDPEQIKLMPKFLPSAKMKHMMDTIISWNETSPDEKILIISQWTSCLDLISNYLIEKEVVHVQYRGDMTLPKRETAVRVFQSREKAKIMLMSRACGGVGLNLTRGNRVICMDLAWSEAVENQAWSRVHRLGQQRPVVVERFIIKDTIEDRILGMQEKKRLLADGSLGEGDGRKLGRLSVRELAALFNIGV
ncbi:hypothetical protein PENSPDRAFT_646154 [Peniophora sp. CONT]|nr:hypothetical protein PENSPDRAFT_646154 [Peniophora sp. CONT]